MATPAYSRLVPVLCKSSLSDTRASRSIMLRYFKSPAPKPPTVIFVPGFMSHGKGLKGEYLAQHCFEKGYHYISYDPEGLNESPGDHETVQFSDWFDDCHTAIEVALKEEPESGIVLVGSSMGGWISLKMSEKHREHIKGLVLIAPALNFMWGFYLEWYNECSDNEKQKLDSGEICNVKTEYGDMAIRKEFAEKSRDMEFCLNKNIDVSCPVRIIHGVEDSVVPFERSMKLMDLIRTDDVDIIYRKRGKHRMSEDSDLKLIAKTLDDLVSLFEIK